MIRELCKHFFQKSLRICKYVLQAQFSNMFWGLMQIWWLGFAEPLYKEAGAKAPASLNFYLD